MLYGPKHQHPSTTSLNREMQIVSTLPALPKAPTVPFFFVLPAKFPVLWLAKRILLLARLWCVQFSACEEVCCTELYTEGQIACIAFGSVGAPLYRHEKRDENNSNSVMIISWLLMNFELSRWFKSCFHNLQQNKIYQG